MTAPVIAPHLVGMAFHDARAVIADLGVVLASPDPDGPPIGALAWPGLFFITSQSPAAGEPMTRGDSIRVTVVKDQDGAAGVPARPAPAPPALTAKAALDEKEAIDAGKVTIDEWQSSSR